MLGNPDAPFVVVSFEEGGTVIEVSWLDGFCRPVLEYLFTRESPHADLFLERVGVSAYAEEGLPPTSSTYDEAWYFKPDGRYFASRRAAGQPVEEAEGLLAEQELAAKREPYPAFDDYDSILRRDR